MKRQKTNRRTFLRRVGGGGGGGGGELIITTSNMQARGQTQTVTLPITAPKPGQEPGHRATLQPGRAG